MPRLHKLYLSSLSLLNISCWIRSQSFVRRSKPVVSGNAIWNTMGLFRMVYRDFQASVHSTCRATPLHCVRFYIRRGRVLRKALPVRKKVSPPCWLQTSDIFFYVMLHHYSQVTMNAMVFQTPASRLYTHGVIQAQIKENIKVPRHWPLWGEFTGDRWIPRTKGQ